MDMGGWTDDDEDAFIEAVEDEHRYGSGEELDDITIEAIEREAGGDQCTTDTQARQPLPCTALPATC